MAKVFTDVVFINGFWYEQTVRKKVVSSVLLNPQPVRLAFSEVNAIKRNIAEVFEIYQKAFIDENDDGVYDAIVLIENYGDALLPFLTLHLEQDPNDGESHFIGITYTDVDDDTMDESA